MLASIIIFGYLGHYCHKYDTSIEQLEIAGPGLVFITIPACLSTMIYPNLWLFVFFVTLILIGIDSQFGITETVTYYLEDQDLRWNGKKLASPIMKLGTCIFIYVIGLPVATKGGQYVLDLMDTFGYSIPVSCCLLAGSYMWSICGLM